MEALVATALGCVLVDLETGEAELVDDEIRRRRSGAASRCPC